MRRETLSVCEPLERRQLLSAATLGHGVLKVSGDVHAPNTIDVELNAQGQVAVNILSPEAKHGATSLSKTFAGTITRIDVTGGNAADTITVGTTSDLDIETRVFGTAGADSVAVGNQNARIFGQRGADAITAGNGNDLIVGGKGANSITAGSGDDTIFGGAGPDTIVAGAGDDVIHGGKGDDSITVNDTFANSSTIFGDAGNDTINVGNGNDTVWGGAGNDTTNAGDGNDLFGCILGSNTVTTGATGHNTYYVGKDNTNSFPDFNSALDTLVTKVKKDIDASPEPAAPTG
jgi:Ca2+-binding RTX toxin-like protein